MLRLNKNGRLTGLFTHRLAPMSHCIARSVWLGQRKTYLNLEAVADYTLWLWCSSFWDRSPILQQFLDGKFSEEVDVEFEINDIIFHQVHWISCHSTFLFGTSLFLFNLQFNYVWFLFDGIFPELARFFKTNEWSNYWSPLKVCKVARGIKQGACIWSSLKEFSFSCEGFGTMILIWHYSSCRNTCVNLHITWWYKRVCRPGWARITWLVPIL